MHIRNFIRLQCFLLALILSWRVASAATYYISSTEGNDTRTAAEAQNAATPWKTLSKLSAITLQPGDQVLLKRGDEFRETYTISISKNSGTIGNPILYGAYGPGDHYPKIIGSEPITGWQPTSFNPSVYFADVPLPVKDLFVNGKRQTLARYPNSGWLRVDAPNGKTGITDADLTQVSGYFDKGNIRIRTIDWVYEVFTIASYSPGQISFNKPSIYGTQKDYGYYIDGLLSLLDAPGEWHYDAAQKRVYYWPEAGQTPENLKMEGVSRDAGIIVQGGNRFVTFDHIELMHQAEKGIHVHGNNESIDINNCFLHDIGVQAIDHSAKNGKIQHNRITNCLDQAIYAYSDNGVIYDNDVSNIAMVPGYGNGKFGFGYLAISVNGQNIKVSHNRVNQVGYIGLGIGAQSDGGVIEKNMVQYAMSILNDGSAISIEFGAKNMIIRNNFMLHSKGSLESKRINDGNIAHGFYFGGKNHQNITLQGNTIAYNEGSGISVLETYNSTIADNTVFDNGFSSVNFLDFSEGSLSPQHNNIIRNNIFFDTNEHTLNIYTSQATIPLHNHGTFSNNYYFNPYSNTTHRYKYNSSSWVNEYYSPSAFRNIPNGDPGSKGSFLSLSPYVTDCNPAGVGTDLIVNGDINTAMVPWRGNAGVNCGSSSDVATYSSHPLLSGGAGLLKNIDSKCNWAILLQDGLNIVANQFYKVTFSCAANSVGILEAFLGTPDWKAIGMEKAQVFVFEPQKNTYTYIFKANESQTNARLCFKNMKPNSEVWIDDISLVPVEVTYDDPKERSQLFINPSDNPKTIALSANYWDIDQNEVSGSLTLAPWSSKILIKKDNAPCGVNQLPTVSLTAPVEGTSFASGGTLNLTATANDLDGQVVKVEFFQGNVKLGESTTAPYSFAWVNPPAGNYQISARATDDKGGTKVSSLVSITVTGAVALTYTVTFTVKDAANALVSGASVTFKGQTVVSNASGVAIFSNIAAGTNLLYETTKTGYNNASGTVNVAANVAHNILLTAVGTPTYTVTFTVKVAGGTLLEGAVVSFNAQNVTTAASGEAVFSNVAPDTDLPYSVSKTGFNAAASALSVASSNVTQTVVLTPSTVTEPNPETELNPNPEPEPEPVAQLNPRNIFSPNGDGINEMWEVEGIEQQPELQVLIFNGYGQRVYQAQPYTNSWDGGGLPDGVYYYQMQNPEGKPVKKGAITLVR
jgi:gliding motility-associated-like protein